MEASLFLPSRRGGSCRDAVSSWPSFSCKTSDNPCAPITTEKSTERQKPCGLVMNWLPHQSWLELFSLVSSFSRASSPWVLCSRVPCPSPSLTPTPSVRGTQGSQPGTGVALATEAEEETRNGTSSRQPAPKVPWCGGRSACFPNHGPHKRSSGNGKEGKENCGN